MFFAVFLFPWKYTEQWKKGVKFLVYVRILGQKRQFYILYHCLVFLFCIRWEGWSWCYVSIFVRVIVLEKRHLRNYLPCKMLNEPTWVMVLWNKGRLEFSWSNPENIITSMSYSIVLWCPYAAHVKDVGGDLRETKCSLCVCVFNLLLPFPKRIPKSLYKISRDQSLSIQLCVIGGFIWINFSGKSGSTYGV